MKLNEYFSSIPKRLNENNYSVLTPDFSKVHQLIKESLWKHFFQVPFVYTQQVSSFIQTHDSSKSTGPDGIGPRILKMTNNIISALITTQQVSYQIS